jgi:hypothetical protein
MIVASRPVPDSNTAIKMKIDLSHGSTWKNAIDMARDRAAASERPRVKPTPS